MSNHVISESSSKYEVHDFLRNFANERGITNLDFLMELPLDGKDILL